MPGGLAEGLWENESETENPFKRVRMETVLRALSDKPWTLNTLPKSHINVVSQDRALEPDGDVCTCLCVWCACMCVCNAATLHCYKHIHLVAQKSPGRGRKSHDVGKCLIHPTSRKRNHDWEMIGNVQCACLCVVDQA